MSSIFETNFSVWYIFKWIFLVENHKFIHSPQLQTQFYIFVTDFWNFFDLIEDGWFGILWITETALFYGNTKQISTVHGRLIFVFVKNDMAIEKNVYPVKLNPALFRIIHVLNCSRCRGNNCFLFVSLIVATYGIFHGINYMVLFDWTSTEYRFNWLRIFKEIYFINLFVWLFFFLLFFFEILKYLRIRLVMRLVYFRW